MSDFNNIPIRDFNGVEQDVGGKIIDSVFHASSLPVNGIVAESAPFTISSTPTDIPLIGVENFMLVDLGTNDTTVQIFVELQYRTAGDWIPGIILPSSDQESLPNVLGYTGSGVRIRLTDVGARVFYVPCLGAVALRIRMTSSTLADVIVKHLVGVPPYTATFAHTEKIKAPSSYTFPTLTTSYSNGQVMGGTQRMVADRQTSRLYQAGAPRILGVSYSDNGRGLADCDVIVCQAGDNTLLANTDAFELDSPYACLGWYEVRASPAAGQFPLRDFGGGIKGFTIQELNLQAEYYQLDTSTLYAAEVVIVNRGGAITPTAGSTILRVMTEM